MRADRIATGDVIKARVKGRTLWGEVTEVKDGVVCFTPISPAAGWRHASAREIIGHWRKTGRHPLAAFSSFESHFPARV